VKLGKLKLVLEYVVDLENPLMVQLATESIGDDLESLAHFRYSELEETIQIVSDGPEAENLTADMILPHITPDTILDELETLEVSERFDGQPIDIGKELGDELNDDA